MELNNQFAESNNIMICGDKNYASWQPESSVNNKIRQDSKLTSNWKYRQYLQNNAQSIMKYNTIETIRASGNNPYVSENIVETPNVPYLFNSIHDTTQSMIGNNNSDLKNDFLKREQMSARMVAPSISIDNFK